MGCLGLSQVDLVRMVRKLLELSKLLKLGTTNTVALVN